MKERVVIVNLIDWSKSFVDEDGSFYSGTTNEQKENAGKVTEVADLVIFASDFHPITGEEHSINGGLYPAHNIGRYWEFGPEFVFHITPDGRRINLGKRSMSPELTNIIQRHIRDRKSAIVAPKEVFYQDGMTKAWCSPGDVEKTFGSVMISEKSFLDGRHSYIIAPKQYYDATRLDSDTLLPSKVGKGIPKTNYNVYSLLKKRYPKEEFDLVFVNTGVVEGICRLHTSIGLKQIFRSSRVINLTDATTPLVGVGLGYETPEQSRDACMRVCRDVGVEYMATREFIDKFGRKG